MVLVKVYRLRCDVCGRTHSGPTLDAGSTGDASNETRKRARRDGWRRRKVSGVWRDYCNKCDPGPGAD